MSDQWNNEYNEYPYTHNYGHTYSGGRGGSSENSGHGQQYSLPQSSDSYHQGFSATAQQYSRIYSQTESVPASNYTTNTLSSSARAGGSSSQVYVSSSQASASTSSSTSPTQADSDASGSDIAFTPHEWIQTGTVTTTRNLSQFVHDGVYDGVRYFYCGVPGCTHAVGFPHKSQLVTHIRSVHLQEKPFMCITCCTPFARKQEAIRHVNTANSRRRYDCDVCGKSFARKHYRDNHREQCMERRREAMQANNLYAGPSSLR